MSATEGVIEEGIDGDETEERVDEGIDGDEIEERVDEGIDGDEIEERVDEGIDGDETAACDGRVTGRKGRGRRRYTGETMDDPPSATEPGHRPSPVTIRGGADV